MSTFSAAILLSRQPLRPSGQTPWVRQVGRAVERIRADGGRVLTSVGLQTWELTAVAAAAADVPQTLYLPDRERERAEHWISTLGLDPARDRVALVPGEGPTTTREFMERRDHLICQHADRLYPVSIRPTGTMARLVEQARGNGRAIIDDFTVPHSDRPSPLKYTLSPERLNPEADWIGRDCLIHWTRTANRAWPDERLYDYYHAIIQSSTYPHSAFDTLVHILSTGVLRGSARHMPAQIPTVSFTGLPPSESIPLMRWRARYSEMSFEPYGVGIRRSAAASMGLRPVRYFDPHRTQPTPGDRWLTQSIGRHTDWRGEREYRCRGDLALHDVTESDLVAFCNTPDEARKITARTGVRAVSVFSE